ncbi:MAG: anti-sigma factor [Candidatus Zixiibacteriota bacterium]
MAENCPDYINDLNDYLDGGVSPELCAEIDAHIGKCENCRIMVDTLKQTVKLCRDGQEEPFPSSLDKKLRGVLKQHWDKKFQQNR